MDKVTSRQVATIQMEGSDLYWACTFLWCFFFFFMLFDAVVAFESVKETLGCYSSNGRDVLYL